MHHPGQECPVAGGLGRGDQRLQKRATDAAAAGLGRNVDALPGDARVDLSRRIATERRPADDRAASTVAGHESAFTGVRMVEVVPVGRFALEGGVAGRDPAA